MDLRTKIRSVRAQSSLYTHLGMDEVADAVLQAGGAPLGHRVVRPRQADLVERQRVVQRKHPAWLQIRHGRRLAHIVAGPPVLANESGRRVAAQLDGICACSRRAAAGGHTVSVGGEAAPMQHLVIIAATGVTAS